MSDDETKEAEFGGWLKRKNVWKPKQKEDRPYLVRRVEEDDGPQYVARLTGDDPEKLDAVVVGDDSEESALETAQHVCENHWRRQQAGPVALDWQYDEETETWTALGLGKPDRELSEWMIGRPPTMEVRAALSLKQATTSEEIEALEIELARKERAHKAEKKRIEKEIAEIRERQIKLATEVRHGVSAKVRCWRERDGDDWRYTDEAGAELYREPAVTEVGQAKQEKLCGDRTAPKEEIKSMVDMDAETPPDVYEGQGATAAAVAAQQERAARAANAADKATAAETDPLPPELDLTARESWQRPASGRYLAGDTEGDNYYVDRGETRLWRCSLYLSGRRRELPGEHKRLKDAFAEADRDNKHRLRWPGDPESGLLVSKCGKYQLSRPLSEQCWCAEAIGGQDEDNTDLGEHDDLQTAQAACQAHHDEQRRAGQ